MTPSEGNDPSSAESAQAMMREMMGPQAVDDAIRRAIHMCWMMLPRDRKTVESVETEIRRVVDRALANMREDSQAFGLPAIDQKPR